MNDFDWLIIQLMLLFWGFIGFVLLMVFGPVVLIIHAARKKKQEESNGTSTPEPSSTTPAVIVSKDDGRVIALEVVEPQPIVPVAASSAKPGKNVAADMAKKVAGKAAGAVAKHYLKRWLLGK